MIIYDFQLYVFIQTKTITTYVIYINYKLPISPLNSSVSAQREMVIGKQ